PRPPSATYALSLHDALPISTMAGAISPSQFDDEYARIFDGDEHWAALASPSGSMYEWDASSTYVQEPPFFASITLDFAEPGDVEDRKSTRLNSSHQIISYAV